MEQILARLSNLSYEVLGIILPGLIMLIMFVLWLVGIGELLPFASQGFFPRLSLGHTADTLEKLGVRTGVGIAGPILLTTYFVGHLLTWISRSGPNDEDAVKKAGRRTWYALTFRVPKPANSYHSKLAPLFEAVKSSFGLGTEAGWREFYPVAKIYLARGSSTSLVSLYQNKYTLHRAITAGAALTFWLTVSALLVGYVTSHQLGVQPRFVALCVLATGCVILAWGFSGSYAYNWEMFGNSIISETYSRIKGPANADS